MEAMSTEELISYRDIQLLTKGFDLCTPTKWYYEDISVA